MTVMNHFLFSSQNGTVHIRSIITAMAVATLLAPLATAGQIEVKEVGDHVLVATGGTWESNLVAIASSDGIAIVDTHDTPASTSEALQKIRTHFPDHRIKYVINTHGHDDHVWGNEVFARAAIIAHPNTYNYMSQRKEELVPFFNGQWVVDLETELASSTSSTDEEQEEIRGRLESAKKAHEKWGRVEITLPTLTLSDGASLYLGEHVIDIINLGAAHSEGDLAVYVPEAGVLIVGDLVGKPRALARLDGTQGDVVGLAAALGRLHTEYGGSAKYLVTGHGPVGDPQWLDGARGYIEYLVAEVAAARERGWSLKQTREKLTLERLRDFTEYAELRENNIEAAWHSLERRQASDQLH